MSTIQRTISGDFSGNINITQFDEEIHGNIVLGNVESADFKYIVTEEDNINFIFGNIVSNSEVSILDTLIQNHIPTQRIANQYENVSLLNQIVNTDFYRSLACFEFPGTKIWKNITNMKILSRMALGGEGYYVRVFDITNNNEIVVKSFDNTSDNVNDLGKLNNLPKNPAILDIQGNVLGKSEALFFNFSIYHD